MLAHALRTVRALEIRAPLAGAGCSMQQVAGYAKGATGGAGSGRTSTLLKLLEPQQLQPVQRTPEELQDAELRSKRYSRLRMREHRAWQRDLSTKLQLKQAALEALPEHLRAAALLPDDERFPRNRNIWRETPPAEPKATKATAAHVSRTRNIGTKRR